MGTVLSLFQTPVDTTAAKSWARGLLAPSKSVREPRGLAAWGGFGDLRRHALPKGDAAVRVWNGFGITNLIGVVLRSKGGVWTATRLIGGFDDPKHPSRKVVYPAPVGGWPAFWRRAEALKVWSLPDESALPQKDRKWVNDGFSTLVETARDGRYRAYAYDNPEFQTQWPEAGRIMALNRLTDAAFPFPKKPKAGKGTTEARRRTSS